MIDRTELLNGRLKLLVLIDILHGNMLLLSSLGTYTYSHIRQLVGNGDVQ